MSAAAILYLAASSTGIGLIIWLVSTRRTDPHGFIHVATCGRHTDAEEARRLLERRAVPVRLDDHRYMNVWSGRPEGAIRLLVPAEHVAAAVAILDDHLALRRRLDYMQLQ